MGYNADYMKLFRNNILRKLITIVILFTSLLVQMRVIYACSLMDNAPQTSCCCDHQEDGTCLMGGDCNTDDGDPADNCCAVSVSVAKDLNLTNAGNAYPPDFSIFDTHYSPLTFDTHPVNYFSNKRSPRVSLDKTALGWYNGTDTYLITLRIRE